MRGILEVMSATAALAEALAPLRADPARSAILLDIDGTLAPIVRHADDAHVPEPTRTQLIAVAKRYGVVGCISGRQASIARRIVSLGSIAYVGNHGSELLAPGGTEVEIDPELAAHEPAVRAFADEVWTQQLQRLRVRAEDKRAIAAFHWRGAPDEDAAEAAVREIAERAEARACSSTGGARCSRCARRSRCTRAAACAGCSPGTASTRASTSATTTPTSTPSTACTRSSRKASSRSRSASACASDETPAELEEASDLLVDGPVGVREMLTALLA